MYPYEAMRNAKSASEMLKILIPNPIPQIPKPSNGGGCAAPAGKDGAQVQGTPPKPKAPLPWKGKFEIQVRAFAPFDRFGGLFGSKGYHGDGAHRGYTTDKNATARLHHIIDIDSVSDKITSSKNFCSETIRYDDMTSATAQAHCHVFKSDKQLYMTHKTFHFTSHVFAVNPLPPVPKFDFSDKHLYKIEKKHTPNIDMFTDITIRQIKLSNGSGTLNIKGDVKGDNFPCTEVFITDSKGTSIFLGVGQLRVGADKDWGPLTDLPLEKTQLITNFNVNIPLDAEGNFSGNFTVHNNRYKNTSIQKKKSNLKLHNLIQFPVQGE